MAYGLTEVRFILPLQVAFELFILRTVITVGLLAIPAVLPNIYDPCRSSSFGKMLTLDPYHLTGNKELLGRTSMDGYQDS